MFILIFHSCSKLFSIFVQNYLTFTNVNTAKSKSVNTPKKTLKKVTYYIEPELDKALKILAVEQEKTISDLANEAVKTFLHQYTKK